MEDAAENAAKPRNEKLAVLWRGEDLIAVDKPAGIAVIPGRDGEVSVLERVAEELGIPSTGSADPRVRIVHRIDKDTSGVLLLALTAAAQRFVTGQFLARSVRKEYLALVSGTPAVDEGVVDAPIGPHPRNRVAMICTPHGRAAVTRWRIDRRLGRWTWLRVFPATGKTHQIRVHLRSIGLPLAIDPLYHRPPPGIDPALYLSDIKSGYRSAGVERPLLSRLPLHAAMLTVRRPDGVEQILESPLPRDLRATLNQLEKIARR